MPILSLIASLGLNKTGFDAGMAAANKSVAKFGAGLKSQLAGAFGAAAFVSFVKSIVDAGDAIDEMSERLGITVEQAQQFSLAAKLGGADAEFFATKFEKLRAKLASGDGNPLAVFGIDTKDPVLAMEQLATQIEKTGLSSEQATKFVEIFGRGSGKLINVLGDLEKARGGLLFSKEQVNDTKRIADFFTMLANDSKVFGTRILEAFEIIGKFGLQGFLKDDWFQADKTGPSTKLNEPGDDLGGAGVRMMSSQKRALEIEREIAKVRDENRISGLSSEERMNDLISQREAIFASIAKDAEERAQKELDILNNEKAIIGLSKKEMGGGGTIAENSLGRIGVFTGAASNASQGQQQVAELQRINSKLSRGIVVKDVQQ